MIDAQENSTLLTSLKTHFGFTAFRPLQEDIICDALAGRDVFALRHMAGQHPVTEQEFSRISGVGEKKLAEFGGTFVDEIKAYLWAKSEAEFPVDGPASL